MHDAPYGIIGRKAVKRGKYCKKLLFFLYFFSSSIHQPYFSHFEQQNSVSCVVQMRLAYLAYGNV